MINKSAPATDRAKKIHTCHNADSTCNVRVWLISAKNCGNFTYRRKGLFSRNSAAIIDRTIEVHIGISVRIRTVSSKSGLNRPKMTGTSSKDESSYSRMTGPPYKYILASPYMCYGSHLLYKFKALFRSATLHKEQRIRSRLLLHAHPHELMSESPHTFAKHHPSFGQFIVFTDQRGYSSVTRNPSWFISPQNLRALHINAKILILQKIASYCRHTH